jgi:uncharacterized repeat protein (TIGR03806 family)
MAAGRRLIVVLALLAAAGCHSSSDGGSTPNPPNPPNPNSGLDQRPSNLTCLAPALNSGAGGTIALAQVFTNLPANEPFSQPLAMLQIPGDSSRWFVLEKTGRVRVFENTPNVSAFDAHFIDLPATFPAFNDDGEGGLLGMAFHPNYATNRYVYLSWTEDGPPGWPMVSVVARFTANPGGLTLDTGTHMDIIRVNQPYTNHNGGQITFGPDGFLYIGLGDGGSGGDPQNHGQDTTDVLGDMLRIDVDGAAPYTIPTTNPFFTTPGAKCPADHTSSANCPEIYSSGLRNPWRWSFDRATGELWLGDVGQNLHEEIDRIERGGNYGWNCREGLSAYGGAPGTCGPASTFVEPVHDYGRSLGASVTGGYVYRGSALPALVGRYVFGDFISGRIWRLNPNGSGGFTSEELLDTNHAISSFGEANDGELYVVDINGGLYRVVDGGGGQPGQPPVAAQLSATGCVSQQNPALPASGLIPYSVAASFWSDSATKERWLAVPNGTTIQVESDGDFTFPPGSVLMKHFRLGATLAETRLFMRHPDGTWAGYSYEWNQQQTDAALVQGGKVAMVAGQNWIFPSGNDCLTCHTAAAGFALGLETAELNHNFTYSSTGRTANQLATLDAIGMFAAPLGNPTSHPQLANPADAAAPLAARARAYLHTNCAHCHRPGGPTPSSMDWRYATLLQNTLACDAAPQSGDLGLGANARIIALGNPNLSVLVERMNRRDANAMPPLASNVIDQAGVTLIRDWITSLTSCM